MGQTNSVTLLIHSMRQFCPILLASTKYTFRTYVELHRLINGRRAPTETKTRPSGVQRSVKVNTRQQKFSH